MADHHPESNGIHIIEAHQQQIISQQQQQIIPQAQQHVNGISTGGINSTDTTPTNNNININTNATHTNPNNNNNNNNNNNSSNNNNNTDLNFSRVPQHHNNESYASNPYITPQNEVLDHSKHDREIVIEVSPNGRYAKLNTILGKGAYKVVFKGIDREEGYEVAWNCFQTTKAEFNELSQEIKILKQVRHPNIINFHDCWYKNDEFIFVTELMTSGTLREYIRKLSLPNMKIVKRWSRQILKGLIYLHSHNPPIIHRDIKCDNIFINGAHGEVKIGDMGTAKMKLGKKYTVIGMQ